METWLATCSEDSSVDQSGLKRLKMALAVCTMPPDKERRLEVKSLCSPQEWHVSQKVRGVKRTAEQLHSAFVAKVVAGGQALRERNSAAKPVESTRLHVASRLVLKKQRS